MVRNDYIHVYIRLPHEMGLERRVTLLLPPLVPSYPPPWTSFWVLALRLKLEHSAFKKCLENDLVFSTTFNWFWIRFLMIFDSKIKNKSMPDWHHSQPGFRSWFLLPIPCIQVLSRIVKTFKTHGLLFKNRLCAFQNLETSIIFSRFEFGTKIYHFWNKIRSQKYIWNRLHLLKPF